ncbi:MAG TPA: ornithine cyclodeaminase family protein [Ktedonobacteraceae bacterium]|nr:ornithine cyclodeaminase family protein [Ktedonobacteraceae bacterium]
MALLLREEDVHAVLTMTDTIKVVEEAFIALAQDRAINRPRIRMLEEQGVMHLLAASVPSLGAMGYKTYTVFRSGMRFVVMLFSTHNGHLLSIIEAEWLGSMRTGATSAIATNYLARPEAAAVGLIGAGQQAMLQLLGVCAVRHISTVNVYSRRLPECEKFCEKMSHGLKIPVRPVASPREAIEEADIVITATASSTPVFPGDWLKAGCHINAIGSNWAGRRELDLATLQRCDRIVTDSCEQAKIEAGDLIIPADEGLFDWNDVHELSDLIEGNIPHRQSAGEITLYKGVGIALEDIATASLVYRLARERSLGTELNLLP